jgi:hypothetical protein
MFIFIWVLTYHWKGLKEKYNFVIKNTSIIICVKSYDHTKFLTRLFLGEHGCFLEQLKPLLLGHMVVPKVNHLPEGIRV